MSDNDNRESFSPNDPREQHITGSSDIPQGTARELSHSGDAVFPEIRESAFRRFQRSPHPHFGWALLWCLAFLLFTQVPAGVIAAVVLIVMTIADPDGMQPPSDGSSSGTTSLMNSSQMSTATMIGFASGHYFGIVLCLLLLFIIVGREWPRKVALRFPSVTHLVLVLAGFPALVVLSGGAYEVVKLFVPGLEGVLPDMEEMVKLFGSWPWSISVLLIGVGPGVTEELWCRAFLGRGLVGSHGRWTGLMMASFLFGAIHLIPRQAIVAMLMGMALHFAYLTTRSLLIPMLLHILNNSLAVVATRWEYTNVVFNESADLPWQVYVASSFLAVAIGVVLYQTRTRLVSRDGGDIWRPAFPGVECPPRNTNTILYHPWPSWYMLLITALCLVAFCGSIGFALR